MAERMCESVLGALGCDTLTRERLHALTLNNLGCLCRADGRSHLARPARHPAIQKGHSSTYLAMGFASVRASRYGIR